MCLKANRSNGGVFNQFFLKIRYNIKKVKCSDGGVFN